MQPLDIVRRVARPSVAAAQSAASLIVSAAPASYVFTRDSTGDNYSGDLATFRSSVRVGDIISEKEDNFRGVVVAIHTGDIFTLGDDCGEPAMFVFSDDGTCWEMLLASTANTVTPSQLASTRSGLEEKLVNATRSLDDADHALNSQINALSSRITALEARIAALE